MVGLLFNGLFAADYIIGLDGVSTGLINGGFLNHNYKQLYIQLAYGMCLHPLLIMTMAIKLLLQNYAVTFHQHPY